MAEASDACCCARARPLVIARQRDSGTTKALNRFASHGIGTYPCCSLSPDRRSKTGAFRYPNATIRTPRKNEWALQGCQEKKRERENVPSLTRKVWVIGSVSAGNDGRD